MQFSGQLPIAHRCLSNVDQFSACVLGAVYSINKTSILSIPYGETALSLVDLLIFHNKNFLKFRLLRLKWQVVLHIIVWSVMPIFRDVSFYGFGEVVGWRFVHLGPSPDLGALRVAWRRGCKSAVWCCSLVAFLQPVLCVAAVDVYLCACLLLPHVDAQLCSCFCRTYLRFTLALAFKYQVTKALPLCIQNSQDL
jgi:hypothetical protein